MVEKNDDLVNLLSDLLKDDSRLDEQISNLSNDQLEELLQKTSYYNNYIPADKKWALVSVTNWEELYMRKFVMTSFVGWMYRALEEWDPEGLDGPNGVSTPESTASSKVKQEIIKQFLDRHLNYNPDKHVKGHHKKKFVKKDDMFTAVWNKDYVKENGENIDVSKPLSLTKTSLDGSCDVSTTDSTISTTESVSESSKVGKDVSMEKLSMILSKPELKAVTEKNVPSDAFYHWNRYIDVNFEELHHATCELYDVLPDLKLSVAFWDAFDREDKATDAKNKWRDSIKIPLDVIENNGHTLLGPWKTNREAIDYHNKNTELLKRMQDQLKSDQKMGEDIMKKNIRVRKAANMKEAGADDPGLQSYQKASNAIESLGCKPVLTKEERTKLEMKQREQDDVDTPDKAVGVDVFSVKYDIETGEQDMTRKRLYTKADNPEEVEEQNRMREAFFEHKLVKNKDGTLIPMEDVQRNLEKLTIDANEALSAAKKLNDNATK